MSTLTSPHDGPDGILDPVADCLTPEVANRILAVRLTPQVQARVDQLAAKANEGVLSADERGEYEDLIEKADMLGIVKSLARQVLAS
jgi:hypothetical protein